MAIDIHQKLARLASPHDIANWIVLNFPLLNREASQTPLPFDFRLHDMYMECEYREKFLKSRICTPATASPAFHRADSGLLGWLTYEKTDRTNSVNVPKVLSNFGIHIFAPTQNIQTATAKIQTNQVMMWLGDWPGIEMSLPKLRKEHEENEVIRKLQGKRPVKFSPKWLPKQQKGHVDG